MLGWLKCLGDSCTAPLSLLYYITPLTIKENEGGVGLFVYVKGVPTNGARPPFPGGSSQN